MMNRRFFIMAGAAGAIATLIPGKVKAMGFFGQKAKADKEKSFPFTLSDDEWKKKLSPMAYNVLRHEATEPAHSSPLYEEHRKGEFTCAGCDWPLFSSEHKYDSGTGWPSFWQPINDKAIGTSIDHKLFYSRTEVHCANCGGHQGHVFEDGPKPTGLRYCINGVALAFKPA